MHDKHGFTLVEMMISIVVFSIAIAAIYSTYQNQQNVYVTQEQVAEAQQNLRAAMFFTDRDIKMAGYDPSEMTEASILIANIAELQFESDENGDAVIQSSERKRFALTNDGSGSPSLIPDPARDGIANALPCRLGKDEGGGLQRVAENIEALEFFYHLSDDAPAPRDRTSVATQADRDEIRSIDVSLLVRTWNPAKKFTDTRTYITASGTVWGPFNDHFRRRLLTTRIRCRNMGLD